MLETVREFSLERLRDHGEDAAVRTAHAAHFLAVAEDARLRLEGPEQATVIDRLQADAANFRDAIAWLVEQENDQAAEGALRLCCALYGYWSRLAQLEEAKTWLERALATGGETPSQYRATGLLHLANYVGDLDDYARAAELYRASLELSRRLDSVPGVVAALTGLGIAHFLMGELEDANARFDEAHALLPADAPARPRALVVLYLGRVALERGAFEQARSLLGEGVERWTELGDPQVLANVYLHLARLERLTGHAAAALAAAERSLELAQSAQAVRAIADVRSELARQALVAADSTLAAVHVREALRLSDGLDDKRSLIEAVETAALRARTLQAIEDAVRLFAATAAWRATVRMPALRSTLPGFAPAEPRSWPMLDPARFANLWGSGQALSVDEGAALALATALDGRSASGRRTIASRGQTDGVRRDAPQKLTARQREVLGLVAEGLTDPEIADRLYLSTRTVNTHLTHILEALDARSRVAAVVCALEHGWI
jgi:non-specific serine/threonine protein kinase